jgi:hypothetical protein
LFHSTLIRAKFQPKPCIQRQKTAKKPALCRTGFLVKPLLFFYTAVAQQSFKTAVIGLFHFGAEHTGSKTALFAVVGNTLTAFAVTGAAGIGAGAGIGGGTGHNQTLLYVSFCEHYYTAKSALFQPKEKGPTKVGPNRRLS